MPIKNAFVRDLAHRLKVMHEDLEAHGQKEGAGLFRAMERLPGGNCRFSVLRMMPEHDESSDQLDTPARLTNDYTSPDGADDEWRALHVLCDAFDHDLRDHMHLENNFPRFVDDCAPAS